MGKVKNGRKKYKNKGLKIQKSFWASISIFWRYITLAIAAFLIAFVIVDYNPYITGLVKHVEKLKGVDAPMEISVGDINKNGLEEPGETWEIITITSLEEYINAVQTYELPGSRDEMPEGYEYNGGDMKIAKLLIEAMDIEEAQNVLKEINKSLKIELSLKEYMDNIANCVLVIGYTMVAVWVVALIYKLYYTGKNSYEFIETEVKGEDEPLKKTLVINTARWFRRKQEIRRLAIEPGAYMEVKRPLKAKILAVISLGFIRYGDLVLYPGNGEAGEIVMHKVRKPGKYMKKLEKIIADSVYQPNVEQRDPYVIIYGKELPDDTKQYTRVV